MIAVKLKGIEEKDTNVLQWDGMLRHNRNNRNCYGAALLRSVKL